MVDDRFSYLGSCVTVHVRGRTANGPAAHAGLRHLWRRLIFRWRRKVARPAPKCAQFCRMLARHGVLCWRCSSLGRFHHHRIGENDRVGKVRIGNQVLSTGFENISSQRIRLGKLSRLVRVLYTADTRPLYYTPFSVPPNEWKKTYGGQQITQKEKMYNELR